MVRGNRRLALVWKICFSRRRNERRGGLGVHDTATFYAAGSTRARYPSQETFILFRHSFLDKRPRLPLTDLFEEIVGDAKHALQGRLQLSPAPGQGGMLVGVPWGAWGTRRGGKADSSLRSETTQYRGGLEPEMNRLGVAAHGAAGKSANVLRN